MESSSTSDGTLRRISVRLVAVLAIAAAGVALFVVIGGSLSDDSGDGQRAERRAQQREKEREDAQTEKVYVVQPNDTLGSIAQKTGVSVETLQQLNPQIDPQALPAGATLKLR